jgi:hypothetical protein
MTRCLRLPVFAIFFAIAVAAGADEPDPVKAKLEQAKMTYNTELEDFQKSVRDHLDAREAAARKVGSKIQVDEIKLDRKQFDEKERLPKSTPTAVRKKGVAALAKIGAAYELAIKEYTMMKMDDAATTITKDYERFKRRTDRFAGTLDFFQVDSVWRGSVVTIQPEGKQVGFELQVVERDGKSFRVASVRADGDTGDGTGTIEKDKLEWKRTMHPPKKPEFTIEYKGVLKQDKLYFEFINNGNGNVGRGVVTLAPPEKKK